MILLVEWKEKLWDKFVTVAPRPRTQSELNTAIASFASAAKRGSGHQSQYCREVAQEGDGVNRFEFVGDHQLK